MRQPQSLASARRTIYRSILFLCGIAVIGWLAWDARIDLAEVFASVRPGLFFAAILLGVMLTVAQGLLFARLLAKHGTEADTQEIIASFLLSQPGKYIPGKVWSAVMQSLALRRESHFAEIAIANIELMIVAMVQMTMLGIAALWIRLPFASAAALGSGMVLCVAIIMLPTRLLFRRLPARIAAIFNINIISEQRQSITTWSAIGLSGLIFGLNLAASICLLSAAGASITHNEYAPILATLYLAFAASFLAVPVPAGIGIREAAAVGLGLIIAPEISSSLIISVALLARCWQLVTDTFCLGIGGTMLAFNPSKSSNV